MAKLDSDVGTRSPDDWPALSGELLIGVTHQISNRVATLAGVSDILSGDPSVPPILRALADEVPKLEEALRLLRLLAAPPGEHEEPLEPYRSLADAMALAALHPACRDVHFTLTEGGDVPPIVAPPMALTHALVRVLVAAAETARTDGADRASGSGYGEMIVVPVRFTEDGSDVVISAGDESVRARQLGA
jgi:hypothetical protein